MLGPRGAVARDQTPVVDRGGRERMLRARATTGHRVSKQTSFATVLVGAVDLDPAVLDAAVVVALDDRADQQHHVAGRGSMKRDCLGPAASREPRQSFASIGAP